MKHAAQVPSAMAAPLAPALARAALSFCTVVHCHQLSFLRDSHSNLAVIAVIFCQNGSVALGSHHTASMRPAKGGAPASPAAQPSLGTADVGWFSLARVTLGLPVAPGPTVRKPHAPAAAEVGLGRLVALHYCSPISYQISYEIRCLVY